MTQELIANMRCIRREEASEVAGNDRSSRNSLLSDGRPRFPAQPESQTDSYDRIPSNPVLTTR